MWSNGAPRRTASCVRARARVIDVFLRSFPPFHSESDGGCQARTCKRLVFSRFAKWSEARSEPESGVSAAELGEILGQQGGGQIFPGAWVVGPPPTSFAGFFHD